MNENDKLSMARLYSYYHAASICSDESKKIIAEKLCLRELKQLQHLPKEGSFAMIQAEVFEWLTYGTPHQTKEWQKQWEKRYKELNNKNEKKT